MILPAQCAFMRDITRTQSAPNMTKLKSPSVTPALVDAVMAERIIALGQRIRSARMHRKWRQVDLAERTRLSRSTIEAIGRGESGTPIGGTLQVLWVMGLDRELGWLRIPGWSGKGLR
jgi:DNA-binding XRE family transcriptional regulator